MYISELYLCNFLSYKDQEFKFEAGKPLLIQGINNSKDSQESNGSGKSGLQSALEYLLLKTTSRKGQDIKLIRRGQKEDAVVSCEIVCPVRKQTLSIKRTIPQKGSTTIEIKINTVKQEIATVPDGNAFILKWLDITSEDLQNYYIINKERYTSFFYSSNSKKISLISRFANINIIDGVEDEVKKDVDEKDKEINVLDTKIIKLDSKLEECKEQLESELDRDLNQEKEDKILDLKTQIKEIQEKDDILLEDIIKMEDNVVENNKKYVNLKAQFDKLSKSIESAKESKYTSKITKINDSIEVVEGDINETNLIKDTFLENIESIDKELRKINVSLAGSVSAVCPKCDHNFKFIPKSDFTIEELEAKKQTYSSDRIETTTNIDETNSIIEELQGDVKKFKEDLSKIKTKQKEDDVKIQLLKEDLDSKEELLSKEKRGIKAIENAINLSKDIVENNALKIKELNTNIEFFTNASVENTTVNDLKTKIKDYQQDIDVVNVDIRDKQEERFKINQWVFNFNNFRLKLAQESLLVIQNKVNEQLKEMNSDLRLKLEGFKQKADGTLKEEITPKIIDNGEEVTFGSLSGGERVRVDYATILSLQDIINQTHPYGGLDLVWTDEIGEGIDPLGLKLLMKSMPKDRTVLVTTHVTIKDLYEGIVMVENNNGISTIV
jgi:DNA repair exonuclease SbcCD ATPase subunit